MFVYAKNWRCACFTVTVNFIFNAISLSRALCHVDTSVHVREELGRTSLVKRSYFIDPSASAVIPVLIAHFSPHEHASAVGS